MKSNGCLLFGGGVVVGVLLCLAVLFLYAKGSANRNNIEMFEKPGEVVESTSFKVMQAIDSQSALVNAKEEGPLENYGFTVYLLCVSEEHAGLYDDQVIEVPKNMEARVCGTYRYKTRLEIEKTVPVIMIMDKEGK